MPKITKLRLQLLQLFRENYGFFFSGHGALRTVTYCTLHYGYR